MNRFLLQNKKNNVKLYYEQSFYNLLFLGVPVPFYLKFRCQGVTALSLTLAQLGTGCRTNNLK